jgi:hypothetical protein
VADDLTEIRARLDHERRSLRRDGEGLELRPSVTRIWAADGSHRSVTWSSLSADSADAVIAEEVGHHRRLGKPFEWKLYGHDGPPDLLDRLRRHGFTIGPKESVLVYDLSRLQNWAEGGEVEVVRVDHSEQVDVYREVAEGVFGKDYAFTAAELAAALRGGSKQHRGYVAYSGSTPAGVGRLYTHPDSVFGGLYGGGTIPQFRGRGIYRAVVAARASDATAAGARYLIVDALPTSRPILERLGFERVTDTWPCTWTPGGE